MSSMTFKHTKSPSGRTHALTDTKTGQSVTKHYTTKPRFDDQVQGDLIREFSRTIFPVVIGVLPVRIDPELLDKGQKAPSLDFLRGYLEGLEYGIAPRTDAIRRTREQIARLEAAQDGLSASQLAQGIPGSGVVHGAAGGVVGGLSRTQQRIHDLGGPITPPGGIVGMQPNLIPGLEAAEHQRRMREQS